MILCLKLMLDVDEKNLELNILIKNYIRDSVKMIKKSEYRKSLNVLYKFLDKNKGKIEITTQESLSLLSREYISCSKIL